VIPTDFAINFNSRLTHVKVGGVLKGDFMTDNEFIKFGEKGLSGFIRHFIKLVFVVSPIITFLVTYSMGAENLLRSFTLSLIVCICCSTLATIGGNVVSALKRWFIYRKSGERADVGVVEGIIYAIPFVVLGMWIGFGIVSSDPIWNQPWESDLRDYKVGMLFGFIIMGGTAAFQLYLKTKEANEKTEALLNEQKAKTLQAQLRSLTTQMNPHLFFNSLNTIASTIGENPKLAEEMVVELSRLFRQVLEASKKDTHTLKEELDVCRKFLEIQKYRYEERLDFSVSVADGIDPEKLTVPVLSLQPLVENSVKHGIQPKLEGGRVDVNAERIASGYRLSVSDTGVGFGNSQSTNGSGSALKNTRERFNFLYGSGLDVTIGKNIPEGTAISIHIPEGQVQHV
jgi:two-component sensor histidine kinase